jgi:hypothetical protein
MRVKNILPQNCDIKPLDIIHNQILKNTERFKWNSLTDAERGYMRDGFQIRLIRKIFPSSNFKN